MSFKVNHFDENYLFIIVRGNTLEGTYVTTDIIEI